LAENVRLKNHSQHDSFRGNGNNIAFFAGRGFCALNLTYPVNEAASSGGLGSGSGAGSSSSRAYNPGGSSGLLAGTGISRAAESVRVRDSVLVATAVGSFVSGVRAGPGLGVKVAVLANGDIVARQNVSVEELASSLVCLQVGSGLSIASSSAKAGIEGTSSEDLAAEESALTVAINGSVNCSVAVVVGRAEAISGLDGVVHVSVRSSDNDLELASVLSSIVGVG